jgi:hypothetical protein
VHRAGLAAVHVDAGDGDAGEQGGAVASRAGGVAQHDRLRRAVAVVGGVGGGQQAVGRDQRRQRLRFGNLDHPGGHAQLVLQRDVALEGGHRRRGGQEEQVADPVQVDLLTGTLGEAAEGLEAARAQLDVDPVGELGAHTARGLAGRALAELVAFEQHDVGHARLGEVERDAGADGAATDDDDLGRGRQGTCGAGGGHAPSFPGADSWSGEPSWTTIADGGRG